MKAPAGGGVPVPVATLEGHSGPTTVAWSPTGEWIAWATRTLTLYSPDGKQQKRLGDRRTHQQVGFSLDGKTLYAYYLDPEERGWVLDAFDVESGRQRRVARIHTDVATMLGNFGLHPDGKRFLATRSRNNPDLVMLEGF